MTEQIDRQHEASTNSAAPSRQLRVLHGLTGAAGQPWAVSRAQRQRGLHADCLNISDSKFGYGSDQQITLGPDQLADLSQMLVEACDAYDVFHFYFRSFFLFEPRRLFFPTGLDLLALRAAGKAVIFHYRGSEVRTAEKFRAFSPHNYVDENPQGLFDKFPTPTVEAFGKFVRGVASAVLVPDPELQSYVPGSRIVPRAVDLSAWECVGVPDDDDPLVVHAPSRRVVKGTDAVIKAVEELKAEGLRFRFQLVENLTNEQAREVYRSASIVVDQLRIGWYGVLAVEAMALGKAAVAYIREDLQHHLDADAPLAYADPATIKSVLRGLITDKAARRELGRRGRGYCEQVHDSQRVAAELETIYREAIDNPPPVSMQACMDFLMVQRDHTAGIYKKLIRTRKHPENWFWKYIYLVEQEGVVQATAQALRKAGELARITRSKNQT